MNIGDVEFSDRGELLVARVTGEIDLSNAASLGAAIAETAPNQALAVVLDLTDLDYLDSAGIHLVYKLRGQLRARGQELRLVIPADSPAGDALRLAGVTLHVAISETLDGALSASA